MRPERPQQALRTGIVAALALVTLAGCGRNFSFPSFGSASAPRAYLAARMCAFQVDGKTREARLRVELTVARTLPPGGVVEMRFENPATPGTPLTATHMVKGTEKVLALISPPLPDIRVRSYETVAVLYSAADRKTVLDTHVQRCHSPFDQRDLGPQFRPLSALPRAEQG